MQSDEKTERERHVKILMNCTSTTPLAAYERKKEKREKRKEKRERRKREERKKKRKRREE